MSAVQFLHMAASGTSSTAVAEVQLRFCGSQFVPL